MSQFGHRGGGGQHFSKLSQNKKCPKDRRGGGGSEKQKCPNFNLGILKIEGEGSLFFKNVQISTLIGTLSQIFSIFYFDASPK